MIAKRPEDTALEELLRTALADDLPPDVAAGMQDRLDRFRERAREKERRSPVPVFLVRRTAWAAISILMLISGGLLQGLGARSPLADRISTIGTFETVLRRLAAVQSMSCSARVQQSDGSFLLYEIGWRGDRGTVAVVKSPEGKILGKFETSEPGRGPDPIFRVVAPLLDPSGVRELLSREWRLVRFSRQGGCDTGIYTAREADGRTVLEFTVDTCMYLPIRIGGIEGATFKAGETGKALWEARLDF